MYPISSQEESWFPGFYWTVRSTLNKYLKRILPSAIGMWEGPWVFCLKWSGYWDSLKERKSDFLAVAWMHAHFSSHNIKGCLNILCSPQRKPYVPPHLDRGPHITWHFKSPTDFSILKGSAACLFLKIDRNPNISVETRKGRMVSHLTSRSVCIILPNLV